MAIKIYVDVLFIINFIIDYTLLLVTSFFIKKKASCFFLCMGSLLGGLYAVFIFFVPTGFFVSAFLTLVVPVLMVSLCYGVKSAGFLLKNTAVFYLVSVLFAGACFSAMFLGNKYAGVNFLLRSGVFYADIDAYTLLSAFIISLFVIHISVGLIKKQRVKSEFLYAVTIEKNGKSVTDTALFDTGNFLKDPLSQKSLVIAEWQTVSRLFDECSLSSCIANRSYDFTYIPCKILGGKTGVFAFSPDKIFSGENDFTESVLVGISEKVLDSEFAYRIILPNNLTF